MVWSFYWKKPASDPYEDAWLSTILYDGMELILGNTGYAALNPANALPLVNVRRGQRPALHPSMHFYVDISKASQ